MLAILQLDSHMSVNRSTYTGADVGRAVAH